LLDQCLPAVELPIMRINIRPQGWPLVVATKYVSGKRNKYTLTFERTQMEMMLMDEGNKSRLIPQVENSNYVQLRIIDTIFYAKIKISASLQNS
jgi:hypothetical protein